MTDRATWRIRLAVVGVIAIESVPMPGHDRFECGDPFGDRRGFVQPLAPTDKGAAAPTQG